MSSEGYETRGRNGSPSSNTDGQKVRERGHEDYMPNQNERPEDDTPAFMLDVPVLNIDEIDLEVNDLRAHVTLRAEVANLVKINVGIDAYLDKVKLDVKGLEAQALLKVRLDRVLGTLDRALEAISKNPQILDEIVQDVDSAIGGAGQKARETEQDVDRTSQLAEDAVGQDDEATKQTGDVIGRVTEETEQAAGGPLNESVDEAGRTVQRAVDESGYVTEAVSHESSEVEGEETTGTLADLQIEEEYLDDWGRIVGRARDEAGNVVEEVLDEESGVPDPSMSEERDQEPENEDAGEVEATDAARRKADELGVKLPDVKGTGSGGRVLVKDVKEAARRATARST